MDLTAIKAALNSVKDSYLAEENAKQALAAAAEARNNAVKALHSLTNGTAITIEGHKLVTVTEGGKGGNSAFVRGAAEWLGLERKATATAKPREVISL